MEIAIFLKSSKCALYYKGKSFIILVSLIGLEHTILDKTHVGHSARFGINIKNFNRNQNYMASPPPPVNVGDC